MPKNHNFASPGYGVPEEIKSWFESFILRDEVLRSPEQKRIARLLQNRSVLKAMRYPYSRIRKKTEWHERFEDFFHAIARLPDFVPPDISLTPEAALRLLDNTQSLALQLAASLRKHPSVFIYSRRKELIAELHALAEEIHARHSSASDPNVGPTVGNCFGKNAERNWIARNISTLAQIHLGDSFPSFVAAVASAMTNSIFTESTIRSLSPHK